MTKEQFYLSKICSHPDEITPRLSFADFLEERGDPRGEFIRVQCALAEMAVDDPRRRALELRAQALFEVHGAEWKAPFRGLANDDELQRGFVEIVDIEASVLSVVAQNCLRLGPIRHLRVLSVTAMIDEAIRSPVLGNIRELTSPINISG